MTGLGSIPKLTGGTVFRDEWVGLVCSVSVGGKGVGIVGPDTIHEGIESTFVVAADA